MLIRSLGFCCLLLLACVQAENKEESSDVSRKEDSMPLGELIFASSEAAPGFVVHPGQGNAQISILNMKGAVVHSWPVDAMRARLQPDCKILVVLGFVLACRVI